MNEGESKDKIATLRERHDFGQYAWLLTVFVANPLIQLLASWISLWRTHHSLRIMQGGSGIFISAAVVIGVCGAIVELALDRRRYGSCGSQSMWWEICTGVMLLILELSTYYVVAFYTSILIVASVTDRTLSHNSTRVLAILLLAVGGISSHG